MVHIRKEAAFLVLALTLNHIFQSQKQVGHRGAFLIAIAVIGILCPVAQSLHEHRGFHIGRAGKGGNSVVAIEGAVVEGLGVGGLRPEKEVVFLPLVHIADHGGSLVGSLGVTVHIGAGEIQPEGHQRGNQFHPHEEQGQKASILPAPVPAAAKLRQLLPVRIPGNPLPEAAPGQNPREYDKKRQIIYNVYRHIPFQIEKRQGRSGLHLPGAGQHQSRQRTGQQHLLQPELPAQGPCPVGHIQQHEAVQEAEAIGDHIGEVEAVPDIVQLPDDKAEVEKHQQRHGADLIPEPHPFCHQVQEGQHKGAHAAVEVGKPLLEAGLNAAAHVSRHLHHGLQKSIDGIAGGDVQPEAGGKFIDAGLGGLQPRQSRKLQHRRHADGQCGEAGDPQEV